MNGLYYSTPKKFDEQNINELKRKIANRERDFPETLCHTLYNSFNEVTQHNIILVFYRLLGALKSHYDIPMDYFSAYLARFIYETIFNVYHDATISLAQTKSINIRDGIRSLYGDSYLEIESIEQSLSKNRKKLLTFSEILFSEKIIKEEDMVFVFKSRHSQKTMAFFQFFQSFFEAPGGKLSSLSDGKDAIFNIENYNDFIYNPNKFLNGIQFYNYRNIVEGFFVKFHQKDIFSREYSAYIFEQLHYPIQFQKCIISFTEQQFAQKGYPETYFPLLLYTKLFDTHYLSLTDHILNKYNAIPTSFYNEDDKSEALRFASFYEMQLYNSYLLPLINYVIKEFLFLIFDGDIDKIQVLSNAFISDTLKNKSQHSVVNLYSFYSMLKDIAYQGSLHTYPGNKKIKLDRVNLKNTSDEYLFNHHSSIAFFEKDIPNYFELLRKNSNYNLETVCELLNDFYVVWKGAFSGATLKSHALKEKLIF